MFEQAGLGESLILDDGNPWCLLGDSSARNFQSAWQSAQGRSQSVSATMALACMCARLVAIRLRNTIICIGEGCEH